MAISNEGCIKEQTIRGLVVDCQKAQGEIKAQIERNFNRQPKTESKPTPVAPNRPNVLDEITDSLIELNVAQKRSIEFIINNINPKL